MSIKIIWIEKKQWRKRKTQIEHISRTGEVGGIIYTNKGSVKRYFNTQVHTVPRNLFTSVNTAVSLLLCTSCVYEIATGKKEGGMVTEIRYRK